MAQWFHRNPIKATGTVNFDLRGIVSSVDAGRICNELKEKRRELLELLCDPANKSEIVSTALEAYWSRFYGLVYAVDENAGDSKIRHKIKFVWTNSLTGKNSSDCYDSLFEASHMFINVALWYTKHALKVAAESETPTENDAKEVYKSLRKAGGIFKFVKDSLIPRLLDQPPETGTDLDSKILGAYIEQCTAEAQEVTMARAMELKHSSDLISALAYETALIFTRAAEEIKSVDPSLVGKWTKYFELKNFVYMAYAYSYFGDTLLAQDKCGEATRCLKESYVYYKKAEEMCAIYGKTKGPGFRARPEQHRFFLRLGPHLKRTLEKCERENGMIYHQKVPEELPDLELKATYGLAKPEEFVLPEKSDVWNEKIYKAFDLSKAMQQTKTTKKKDKDAPAPGKIGKKEDGSGVNDIKEKEIKHAGTNPQNDSGCSIS